jgi:TRAP transporter TAXI family solute receptor
MITSKPVKHFCFTWFFKQARFIAVCLIIGSFPVAANALDILLGTGETGTFSHFTGRTICRMISSHADDINCKAVPAPDDVHNLTNLRGGALDIGLVDSRQLHDAINKTGYFKFLDISYDNLRTLIPLYDVPVMLVVRRDAGITSLEALKGKRINAGAPGSLENLAVDTIMSAKTWSKADFSLVQELPASQSQDTMAFCYGTVQAMVHIGVHPDPSLQQLLQRCKAGLADMDDSDTNKLVNDHPAFYQINIAANTYPTYPKGVTTFGTRMTLVAPEDLDEETVYQIIEAIHSNQKRLQSAHPSLSSFTVQSAGKDDTEVKPHPGAARYFSEHGL